MRLSLLCLLLLCTTTLLAQEQLSDRWKETQRLDKNKKNIPYTDTMRLLNVSKESMHLRKGSFLYKGEISNDLLDFGYEQYGIMRQTKEEIRLRDENYIHIFSREARDLSAADAAERRKAMMLPEQPVDSISRQLLSGIWEVYKREGKNGPLTNPDYSTMITRVTVASDNGELRWGSINGGLSQEILYTISGASGPDLLIRDTAQQEQRIKVWRLSKEELVLEDARGIIYYLKHFR